MLKKFLLILTSLLFSLQLHAADTQELKEKANALIEETGQVASEIVAEATDGLSDKASQAAEEVGSGLRDFGSKLWDKGKEAAEIAKDELNNAKEYIEKKYDENQPESSEAEETPKTIAL